MNEVREFLEALFFNKPPNLYVLIWTVRGDCKWSRWFRDIQQAAAYVDSLSGCNVYVGVGLSPADFGKFKRCESDSAAGVVGLAADIDLKSEAHPKGSRPETIEQALWILPPELPPSIVIETGNGIQCWWLLREPWIFCDAADRQQAAAIFSRWQTLLKYACQRHGWTFERLKDLARVLRVPGTSNLKDPANPKVVRIRDLNDRRYDLADFRDYLDNLSIPSEDELAQDAKKWTERFSDKPPAIGLAAEIPDDLLARWMEQDSRFRATWHHQRDDLTDQSQSGYDLALANFGVKSGLSEQHIVNLLIHNRRLHGAKQCMRLDYYQRTLSKARKSAGDPVVGKNEGEHFACDNAALLNASQGKHDGSSDEQSPRRDPNEKAKLCDKISAILGVPVLQMARLNGSEPVYLMEIESGCIEFPDVGKLMSNNYVRQALAAKAGIVIRRITGKPWDQIVQMMLDACTDREGTDDLETKGQARINITKYLSDNPPLAVVERRSGPNSYGPVIHKGRIAISATDLQIYILRTTMQNLSVKRVATMISMLGGEAARVRDKGVKGQDRWALPVAEFDPKDYQQPEDDCGHE